MCWLVRNILKLVAYNNPTIEQTQIKRYEGSLIVLKLIVGRKELVFDCLSMNCYVIKHFACQI